MLDDNDRLRAQGPGAISPWDGLTRVDDPLGQLRSLEKFAAPSGTWMDGEDLPDLLVPDRHLIAVTAEDLLTRTLPPREYLLGPWLRAKDLGMIYAPRGGSKTWFSLGVACAVAAGGKFLHWKAPRSRKVLYVDGELPIELLKERMSIIMRACDLDTQGNLMIITPDLQEFGTPNIATPVGQAMIEEHLDGEGLLFLDNLSCLCRGGVENEAESWDPVQEWLLRLRSQGLAALFDHHAGRSGKARGTSKREDVLDLVLALKAPKDYNPEDGARFEIHFEKARGLHGSVVEPMEAWLKEGQDGSPCWVTQSVQAAIKQRVIDLAAEGMSQSQIAKEVGRDKSTVSRTLKEARLSKALVGKDDATIRIRTQIREKLVQAGQKGCTDVQLARDLGVSEHVLHPHLLNHDVGAERRSDGTWYVR